MSNAIFPSLRGVAAERDSTPQFDNIVQRAAGGRRYALGKRFYPVWRIRLKVNFLRQKLTHTELADLEGFFLQRHGNLDSFLYRDREWNTVATPQVFGIGDGMTTDFRLVYSRGGFIDRVGYSGDPLIYVDAGDWRGNLPQYRTPRSNLLARSEHLDVSAAWATTGAAVTANASTAPDGTAAADQVAGTFGGNDFISQSTGLPSGTVVTFSVYVKNKDATQSKIMARSGSTAFEGVITWAGPVLSALTLNVGTACSFTSVGGDWYRVECHFTTSELNQVVRLYGTNGTDSLAAYFWGAQLEAGATLTPYVKTLATPVTVTDYTISNNALVSFATAPPTAASMTWTGAFHYRVAFSKPDLTFTQFLKDLYSVSGVELESTNV